MLKLWSSESETLTNQMGNSSLLTWSIRSRNCAWRCVFPLAFLFPPACIVFWWIGLVMPRNYSAFGIVLIGRQMKPKSPFLNLYTASDMRLNGFLRVLRNKELDDIKITGNLAEKEYEHEESRYRNWR